MALHLRVKTQNMNTSSDKRTEPWKHRDNNEIWTWNSAPAFGSVGGAR